MSKINVTHIDSLDISQMTNTQVTVSGSSMTLTPLPSDESDYERGMRRAMQKIAASCGRVFGADVGYEDLPDLVEYILVSKKEKPKPTKFVKVEESIFDLKEEFEKGELYAANGREKYFVINNEDWLTNAKSKGNIYRQVEIDWRDEVKGKYSLTDFRSLDDEGCINLGDWTPEGFIKLCHFVAELTDKPE